MQTLYINGNDSGQRLDKFITKSLKTLPYSLLYKYIRTKKIKVNRKRTTQNYILCEGDTVELFIKDEFFDVGAVDNVYKNITPKLDIVYEDENIILCDKKPGMIVHPDEDEEVNTLISHVKAYLYKKGEYKPEAENSFVPSLCNRIDRNTGGIVIAAKNAMTLRIINEKIRNNEICKFYLCIVHGIPEKKIDTLSGYLKKDNENNIVKVYDEKPLNDTNIKNIITKYRVINENEKKDLSLVEVELITGRTHQIRAHFASIGHPLLGDGKYGVNRDDRKVGHKFQALYSYSILFNFDKNGNNAELNYLNGLRFFVDKSKIWFLDEFI